MEFKGTKGKWEKVTADWDLNQSVYLEDTEEIICDVKSLSPYAIYDALLISKAPKFIEETQDTIDELKILKSTILDASKTNNKLESIAEVIQDLIDRKEELIKEATEL